MVWCSVALLTLLGCVTLSWVVTAAPLPLPQMRSLPKSDPPRCHPQPCPPPPPPLPAQPYPPTIRTPLPALLQMRSLRERVAELQAAHGAEVGGLVFLGWEGLG